MEQAIVLGRIGHYFNSGNGSCSTAIVVAVRGAQDEKGTEFATVNIAGWTHTGSPFSHEDVVVGDPAKDDTESSFHLNRDCQWGR